MIELGLIILVTIALLVVLHRVAVHLATKLLWTKVYAPLPPVTYIPHLLVTWTRNGRIRWYQKDTGGYFAAHLCYSFFLEPVKGLDNRDTGKMTLVTLTTEEGHSPLYSCIEMEEPWLTTLLGYIQESREVES